MPEYPYTDTEERVFSDLSHGPAVRVVRDGEPVEADAGSTVVLRPGDVLVTDEPLPFSHAFLEGSVHPEPVEAETPDAPQEEEPAPEPVPDAAPARRRKPAGSGETPGDTPTA